MVLVYKNLQNWVILDKGKCERTYSSTVWFANLGHGYFCGNHPIELNIDGIDGWRVN